MEDDDVVIDDVGQLDVRYRGWTQLHASILTFASKLVVLDFSFNNIQSLPDQFGNLRRLTHLNCSCNQLDNLPLSVGKLKRLKVLKANGNRIINLPDTIGDCINLETLNLSENQLKILPETLGNCVSLASIQLQNNDLLQLPLTLAGLKDTIKDINVKNNQNLRMIPKKVHGSSQVIMWILSIHYENYKELNEIREVTREIGWQIKVDEENIAFARVQIEKLNEERTCLILERESIKHFLLARTLTERCRVRTKVYLSHCRNLIDRRAPKISYSTSI